MLVDNRRDYTIQTVKIDWQIVDLTIKNKQSRINEISFYVKNKCIKYIQQFSNTDIPQFNMWRGDIW